jgi:uncharacterized protein (DUF1778 family)
MAQQTSSEKRTRAVRLRLTSDDHHVVRQAAAITDKSMSRFAEDAVIKAAQAATQQPVTKSR